ncbi:hypothetical protein RRF57_002421 [Xylaria bambusicola]|uniref:Uncharacterized protein n=1 Tax=Xylaria bambusicola TaxID=326684 RepID=A0AAN7Z6V9_9PEZI
MAFFIFNRSHHKNQSGRGLQYLMYRYIGKEWKQTKAIRDVCSNGIGLMSTNATQEPHSVFTSSTNTLPLNMPPKVQNNQLSDKEKDNQLTEKEKEILTMAWLHMDMRPKVDYESLAKALNYKNHKSVANLVCCKLTHPSISPKSDIDIVTTNALLFLHRTAATKKLKALYPGDGDAFPQPSPIKKNNAAASKRKANDDDATEDERVTAKKRAKVQAKKGKAAVARDEDEELAYIKGERVDDEEV